MAMTEITRDAISKKVAQASANKTAQAIGLSGGFIEEKWLLNDSSLESIDTEQKSVIINSRS